MENIDFNKFELVGKQIMIELPTEQKLGKGFSLMMIHDNKTLTSGWFKVVKVGKEVTNVKEGEEAYIFFHNKPYEVDEITIRSRQDQFEHLKEQQVKSKIVKLENPFVVPDIIRQFNIVPEHSVLLTRPYEEVVE